MSEMPTSSFQPPCFAALLASLLMAGAGTAQAQATGGKINFEGSITAVPCTIDTDSTDQTVKMDKVFANDFASVGATSTVKKFEIRLKNCGESTNGATVKFTGTGDADGLHVNGGAKGLALQILDDTGAPINLATDSKKYDITRGDNAFGFGARYIRTGDITAGRADATAAFALTYK
jgi:major type 1 subunit fimbrin (pilin)